MDCIRQSQVAGQSTQRSTAESSRLKSHSSAAIGVGLSHVGVGNSDDLRVQSDWALASGSERIRIVSDTLVLVPALVSKPG